MRINDLRGMLTSAFMDWNGFLINNRFIRKNNEITWEGFQKIDHLYPITANFVQKLIENRQYSFQVEQDNSIFQIYYLYDQEGRRLLNASLSFYYLGAVVHRETTIDYELIESLPDNEIGWLRIDYDCDPSRDKGVVHSTSHMHLGFFPNSRVMVDRVPNPKQFIEFIIATCYPDSYRSARLDEKGRFQNYKHICSMNSALIPEHTTDELCDFVTHIRIPSKTVTDK